MALNLIRMMILHGTVIKGTAINLFIRNLPRLSVDIELVYLPMYEREVALTNIREAPILNLPVAVFSY